jgi:ferrous iron transport protein A
VGDAEGDVPLWRLRSGQVGRISEVSGKGELTHRLRELGLRDGVEVEMIRAGTPCIIRLGAQKLCIRVDDAVGVLVRTSGDGPGRDGARRGHRGGRGRGRGAE